jgi:peptide/nickel transport system permease protein
MSGWLIRRIAQAAFVVLLMTLIVFIGLHAIGNPIDILIGQDVDQVDRARIIAQLGLDQPLWKQYLAFLAGAMHGDLGNSFVYNEPAMRLILQRLPATLELAVSGAPAGAGNWYSAGFVRGPCIRAIRSQRC